METTVKEGIKISVRTHYLEGESEPEEGKYYYVYTVAIENQGVQPAQLLTRHWIIKNALNEVQEVYGEGVVGKTPYLAPGEHFIYASLCPLSTPWGVMGGSYGMTRPDGSHFDVRVQTFALLPPYMLN
jgi:ApaG protein